MTTVTPNYTILLKELLKVITINEENNEKLQKEVKEGDERIEALEEDLEATKEYHRNQARNRENEKKC